MKLLVLETIVDSRSQRIRERGKPPFIVHLAPKRAERLVEEMASIGAHFGIPLGHVVPDPREDEYEWKYLGLVLGDCHVFARQDAPR